MWSTAGLQCPATRARLRGTCTGRGNWSTRSLLARTFPCLVMGRTSTFDRGNFFCIFHAKMQDGEYPDHLLWNPQSQAWEVRLGSQLVKDHRTEKSSPRASEELGIVYRGEGELTDGQTWIELPSTSSHFTVSLTQILRGGNNQFARLMASPVAGGGFTVYGDPCYFAWHVFGPKKA